MIPQVSEYTSDVIASTFAELYDWFGKARATSSNQSE